MSTTLGHSEPLGVQLHANGRGTVSSDRRLSRVDLVVGIVRNSRGSAVPAVMAGAMIAVSLLALVFDLAIS